MSSLGIVGVVFGAFNILLSSIQTYEETLGMVDTIWHFERTFGKFSRRVEREHLLYRQNLQRLLEPLVEQNTWDLLLESPELEFWKAPALGESVKGRLAHYYDTYIDTAKDINVTLRDLEKLVGKGRALMTDQVSHNGLF